jgi:hypothetical protein
VGMDNNPRQSRIELPRSILGRVSFGAVCLLLLVPSAVFSYASLFGNACCNTVEGFVFHWIGESLCVSLFFFSLFGLIWALAVPNWVDDLFQKAARKLILVLFLFCLLSLPFAFWALWKA